jgi:hypothetical protein
VKIRHQFFGQEQNRAFGFGLALFILVYFVAALCFIILE